MNRTLKFALGALAFAGYTALAIKNPALMPAYLEYATRTVASLASTATAPASAPAASAPTAAAAKP
ncbi:hypothetical protein ACSI5F_04050 [Ralstonia pseudosolanacearum]|uniref:hypothetical protein n=1 Tax=Ralstonia pseudosolanacearum TaxID=1310165 RepID=UPI003EE418D7